MILFPSEFWSVISDSLIYKLTKSLEKIDTNNIDITSVNDIKLDEIEVQLNEAIYSSVQQVSYTAESYKSGEESQFIPHNNK